MHRRHTLERIFRAGIAACHPERVLPAWLPEPPAGRTILLAVGKAAATMAAVVEARWQGPLAGLIVAPHGAPAAPDRVPMITAAHPVPDAASVRAAERLLALAQEAGPDDLVLVLLSGGASSLACLPAEGMTLAAKQALVRALLRSGAPIESINCVRRHLSRIKGGRLGAAARPARLVTLAISDVAGDAPHDIGSGPTVPDPSRREDAEAILRKYDIPLPPRWADDPPHAVLPSRPEFHLVASGRDAVDAAAAEAERLGYQAQVIGYALEGEARELATAHAAGARRALAGAQKVALISGGEATVEVRGSGSGGPNREFALALALELKGVRGWSALAADTDGIDGTPPAAGAFVDDASLQRSSSRNPQRLLAANDSAAFFDALGDALVTGPTGTNVNDLRIILVDPFASAPAGAKAPS